MDDQAKGSTGETRPRIFTVKCKDRTKKVIHFRPVRLQSGDELIIYEDITEKRQLEAQLLQARKMESVGRLAGGLAHDFNNMLQAILGQTELALLGIGPEDPLYNHFQHIRSSAWRSADLVRQLLAFARKQTIRPKVMDLNATVAGMLNMLGRLIGENIDLTWKPGPELWHVRIDPSQIDQILANLAVNARDAIGGVGKITIETRNIELDSAYCADHVGFVTGFYVMLAVSDNGCGMDRRTLDQIFEPFFSTKVVGKGTGLGLATVYGIVKQNSGFINVYSEPGYGTTFKIYLPRIAEALSPAAAENQDAKIPTGTETLLIVEDDQAILALAMSILQGLGYHVLAANSPSRAQQLGQSYSGNIHLLLTDVVMPEMNGRDLARELLSIQPAMKCLFMSGYTANVIAHHGVLDEEVFFIQKPFSVAELAIKVRRVLDGRQAA
jgi:signal transduction histidine kinase/CheY-like chemotaxis protein